MREERRVRLGLGPIVVLLFTIHGLQLQFHYLNCMGGTSKQIVEHFSIAF